MASILGFIKDALAPSTQMFIDLKQLTVWEGDVVEGEVVVLSMQYPYKAHLRIEFNGYAQGKAEWLDNTETFVAMDILLHDGEISQRQQSFPFKFTLPSSCPNTFYTYKNSNHHATVNYFTRAILKVPYRLDQQVQEYVIVQEKQKMIASPVSAYSHEHYFSNSVGISVWIDRHVYFPGDNIIARIKARNNTYTVPNLRLRLVHAIFRERICFSEEPKIIQIPIPSLYYGAMWTTFTIPLNVSYSSFSVAFSSHYYLQFDFNEYKARVGIPIIILPRQEIQSMHPIAPPDALLPPVTSYRPVLQNEDQVVHCNLCGAEFGLLWRKEHCRYCGKIFCGDCANMKTPIKKMRYLHPVPVCRSCMRVVEETGGIKYQTGKRIIEEWSRQPGVQWVPRCSKKAFNWAEIQFILPHIKYMKATSPN